MLGFGYVIVSGCVDTTCFVLVCLIWGGAVWVAAVFVFVCYCLLVLCFDCLSWLFVLFGVVFLIIVNSVVKFGALCVIGFRVAFCYLHGLCIVSGFGVGCMLCIVVIILGFAIGLFVIVVGLFCMVFIVVYFVFEFVLLVVFGCCLSVLLGFAFDCLDFECWIWFLDGCWFLLWMFLYVCLQSCNSVVCFFGNECVSFVLLYVLL